MDLSVSTYITEKSVKEAQWISSISKSLPKEGGPYRLVSSVRLVGMLLTLFVRDQSRVAIADVQTAFVATGLQVLMNKLGNKGGVAVSLRLNDTRVCFVNSHFAAGDEAVSRRNDDFREISQLIFPNALRIEDHEAVIWIGDLNYRINAQVNGLSNEDVRKIASSTHFHKLLRYDQLKEQQKLGRSLVGYSEGKLSFPPTYKYDVGSDRWDSSEKARSPAWCDRVLWTTRDEESTVQQITYESVPAVSLSDHKPVRAEFAVSTRKIDQKKADSMYEEAIREADRKANELLPHVDISPTEACDCTSDSIKCCLFFYLAGMVAHLLC